MRVEAKRDAPRRAIVIGGGMVGLAVAKALSSSFREVLVVEKDTLPRSAPEHRRGVPQSWHIHNLMLRGQRELETLFPGFVNQALRLGAQQIDYSGDVAAFTSLGWEPQIFTGYVALSATRILLEFAERQRFLALTPNARILEGTRVERLITEQSDRGFRAVGVLTDDPAQPEHRADLVVDCMGRGSRWKSWFEQTGVRLPDETVVDSRCGYSSRFYRPQHPEPRAWKAMVVDAVFPRQPHWGVLVPIENDSWAVTLGGFNGNYPPADTDGFAEFARSLQTPHFSEALERAIPLSDVKTFRKLEMRWNHFERYDHPISNFLVIGDAAWAYNPVYGQGMSIGVTCARILRDVLAESGELRDLPRRYYRRAHAFAHPPWGATAMIEMRWPDTIGARPWHAKLTLPLSDLIVHAGHCDEVVALSLLDGIHLLKSPYHVLTPRAVARVGLYAFRRLTARLPPPRTQLPAASALG